jgi:hypothetical protein
VGIFITTTRLEVHLTLSGGLANFIRIAPPGKIKATGNGAQHAWHSDNRAGNQRSQVKQMQAMFRKMPVSRERLTSSASLVYILDIFRELNL